MNRLTGEYIMPCAESAVFGIYKDYVQQQEMRIIFCCAAERQQKSRIYEIKNRRHCERVYR